MLDRLLGRAALREELEELRAERDSLAAQLEAESERRSEAARARQEAEERVNRLEDRVTELEDRVQRAAGDDGPSVRRRERLTRDRLDEVLDRLDSVETEREGALTAAVDESTRPPVADALGDRAVLVRQAAPTVVCVDDAGLVSVALSPPIQPEPFCEWGSGFRLDREWFQPTGRFGFALVRSDTYAGGVYEGADRQTFAGFQTDVMSEHDKGGFSQARFERRREEEIDDHLDRVRTALDDLGGDRLILVGESTALDRLPVDADHTAAVDATGHDEDTLDRAFRDFWTTELTAL